jgi:hypothetical protein
VLRKAPAHHTVELSDTGRYRRPGHPVRDRGVRQYCLGARIDENPLIGNAKRMLAPQVTSTPQFMNLNDPFGMSAVKFCLELDYPIH